MTLAQEVADTELGDKRQTDRHFQIVDAVTKHPVRSISEAPEDEAAQEGDYRFIRSPKVESGVLLEPHIKATASRAERVSHVLFIQDTTEFACKL